MSSVFSSNRNSVLLVDTSSSYISYQTMSSAIVSIQPLISLFQMQNINTFFFTTAHNFERPIILAVKFQDEIQLLLTVAGTSVA